MTKAAAPQIDFLIDSSFEDILTNPILDIAARVWAEDRYQAFRVCYRSMRLIDDLVDDRQATGAPVTEEEIAEYRRRLDDWLEQMRRKDPGDEFSSELLATLERFAVPLWPWERLCRAMLYELSRQEFPSFLSFLRYTEGAAIAPAAIFMHLCGLRQTEGKTEPPVYDIRQAARPLAVFSYLVHIMRDFQKDMAAGLNYFPRRLLDRFKLTVPELREMASAAKPDNRLRGLFRLYVDLAERYRVKARANLDRILPLLTSRYRLSLELIYALYVQIYERMDPENASFTGAEHQPPPDAINERIRLTVKKFAGSEEIVGKILSS